jgi:hypothetical protein
MPIERLDEIMHQLGADPRARADIAEGVEHSIGWFRRNDALFARKGRRAMKTSAQKIIRQIDALRTEVRRAPHALRYFLILPPAARDPRTLAQVQLPSTDSPLYVLRNMHADCKRLLRDLKAVTPEPEPSGPEKNRVQLHCADLGYRLMLRYSDKKITSSVDGRFATLASLLYEALTGRADVDLQRHCIEVLKNPPRIEVLKNLPRPSSDKLDR